METFRLQRLPAATAYHRKMKPRWKTLRVISSGHRFLRIGCDIWNRKVRWFIHPKMAGQARTSPQWNGWRPCVRTFPTGVSRWSGTMAITVTSRAEREKKPEQTMPTPDVLEPVGNAKSYRKSWARLIQKIYQVDPLVCPKCQGIMRIISFIEAQQVIRDILTHLGLWLVRSAPPPACARMADRPQICAAITLSESKDSESYAHPPHQQADAYADPEYSDDYIQS